VKREYVKRDGAARLSRFTSSRFRLPWRLGVLAVASFFLTGCSATIYPPAHLEEPVAVYFAQYNVHSTVIMPQDGKYVDFSFGDWNYAAMRHKWINDALGALTISWASTLEKHVLEIDPKTGEPIINDNPDMIIRMYADRATVERRVAELQKRFDEDVARFGKGGMITYDDGKDIYVKDEQHYSVLNNCNNMTAQTFRDLGFKVDGPIIGNQFHLCRPQEMTDSGTSSGEAVAAEGH
jgi:hypothetical protein